MNTYERHLLRKSHLEAGMRETGDALGGVVLGLCHAATLLELEDLDLLGLATFRGIHHGQLSRAGNDLVLRPVLVTEGVTTDNDGLLPSRY